MHERSLDAWLAAIDRGDILEMRQPGKQTRFCAGRLAGHYATKTDGDVWIAPANPESRANLRSQLASFVDAQDLEPMWRANDSGVTDAFESTTHALAFVHRGGAMYFERMPDGNYLETHVLDWNGDPMGGAWTEVRTHTHQPAVALVNVLDHMRTYEFARPFPLIIPRDQVRRSE